MSGIGTTPFTPYYINVKQDRAGNILPVRSIVTTFLSILSTTIFNNAVTLYFRNLISTTNPAGTNSFYINNPVTTPQNNQNNTVIGVAAGINLDPTSPQNTIYGNEAGTALTTGGAVTLVGYQAGKTLTTVGNNTAIGHTALRDCTTGNHHVAIGQAAGRSITTGTDDICIGFFGGSQVGTGSFNIVISSNGLGVSSGNRNVCIGSGSSLTALTASDVVAVGNGAGVNNPAGDSCTYVGKGAGQTGAGPFSHSTAIGADSRFIASNQVQVGQLNTDDVVTGRDLTVTRNTITAGANGIRYTGTITASGATPQTLNTMVGRVTFTGVADMAADATTSVVINNSLVTASTVGIVTMQTTTAAAGSTPRIETVTFGAGTITIAIRNSDPATATGAGATYVFSFALWQL